MSMSRFSDNTYKAVSVPTCAPDARRGSGTNPGQQCWVVPNPYTELRGPSNPAAPDLAAGAGQHMFCHCCPCSAPVQEPPLVQTNGRGWACCSSAAARQGCPPAASSSLAWAGTCREPSCGEGARIVPPPPQGRLQGPEPASPHLKNITYTKGHFLPCWLPRSCLSAGRGQRRTLPQ